MRHCKTVNHLSRTASHRKALLANLANALITHKRITTTKAKAKSLRSYIEPLLTKAKNDTTHSRRTVFGYLKDKHVVSELFRDVANRIVDRPGGYTRILKLGNRLGDNAEVCMIELVDYNEYEYGAAAKNKNQSETGRNVRRRRKKATTDSATELGTVTEVDDSSSVVNSDFDAQS